MRIFLNVVRLLKLWLNRFCNLLSRMGVDVLKPSLNCVRKALYHIRVFLKEALLRTVGSVGYIAGIHAQRSYHDTVSFFLEAGGKGLEFNGVIVNTALIIKI